MAGSYDEQAKRYDALALNSSNNDSMSEVWKLLNGDNQYFDDRIDGRHITVLVLCGLAIVTNVTTLTAIRHIRLRLSANQMMMFSLCCADLLTSVGVLMKVITQQAFEPYSVPEDQYGAALCVHKVVQGLIFTGHNATLCNLLALAVDHYCAIARPLTYSLYMSKRRVKIILGFFWFISILFGFSDFLIPFPLHEYCYAMEPLINYCERIKCSLYEPDHLMFCVVFVCLVVMSTMYICIMCILYRYQQQEYATVSQRKAKRHIRGLITSFIILGLFAVLWLPNCILDAYIILKMTVSKDMSYQRLHDKVFWYLYALVILNAVCDPIVYAMRMREIQGSLKLLLCFQRPKFNAKMNGFNDALRQNSSGNIPVKYVQRQFSNSTNTTSYSSTHNTPAGTDKRMSILSRKGTLSSQTSDVTEDTPLNRLEEELDL